jgi:hypothetical protein
MKLVVMYFLNWILDLKRKQTIEKMRYILNANSLLLLNFLVS